MIDQTETPRSIRRVRPPLLSSYRIDGDHVVILLYEGRHNTVAVCIATTAILSTADLDWLLLSRLGESVLTQTMFAELSACLLEAKTHLLIHEKETA